MEKLFSQSGDSSLIFRNQRILMPEYAPTELIYRDSQIREIADAFKPALKHAKPQNLFIHGPTGTGKTSSIRYVFNELKDYSSKIVCIYINCWEHPSRQAILSKISEGLKESMPRRGLADDEIFQRILERLRYDKKIAIICLDEIDRLMHKGESELLYNLSRSNESNNVIFGIIGITNAKEIFYSLDERMKSSLSFKEMEFPQYSPAQLKEILKERAKEAFLPGVCSEEVIALSAAHGAKNKGDARIAIETLLQAALKADSKNKKKIDISDVREIIEKTADASLMKNAQLMGENEKLLLEILKDAKHKNLTLTSGDVYHKFNELREKHGQDPLSERQIMNYLQMFESAKLISAELSSDPSTKAGKTKLIKLIR
jgi:cell division control protein 6